MLTTTAPLPNFEWPYVEILIRLALALALGLLIGLERERRGKEAGLRTFGFIALLGALGGSLGENFAILSLARARRRPHDPAPSCCTRSRRPQSW